MRTDVTFRSAGLELAAHLYTPADAPAGPLPAIVVGNPASSVKEQSAGLYAERLAALGFVTLAYDPAFQGESGGLPRGLEDPAQRVEDLRSAVSFLSTRPEVDPAAIGMLGICASGGYAVQAAATDPRVRALATVSAADIGRQFREGADGRQNASVLRGLLAAAAAERTAGTDSTGFDIFPATREQALAGGRHVFEGWEYYTTDRARHPRSARQLTWSSVDRIATADPFRFIGLLAPRPLLMIVGSEAVTYHMSTEPFRNAHEPKELHWIEGATHVALYDRDEYVGPAVDRLDAFFRTHLTAVAA